MTTLKINAHEAVLLAISTLTVLAGATIAPSLPYIAAYFMQLEHNEFWAQLALSLPGICVAFSAAWIGRKFAQENTSLILIASLIGYGAFGMSYLLAPEQLALLLVSRGALGFCVAAIMIMTTVLLVKNKPAEKISLLLGYQAAAGGFGGVLYMALANQLTQWYGLAPFGLYAIAWILASLLWASNKRVKKEQLEIDGSAPYRGTTLGASAPSSTTFLFFATFAAVEMLALYALVLQIPLLAVSTPYHLSTALTFALLCMSTTAALYSFFQRYLSMETQHMLGMFIIATGFTLLGLAGTTINLILLILVLCVIGFGLGLLRPNLVAWLFSIISPATRQTAMGKLTAVFFSAQFLAPLIIYPLTKVFGLAVMWLVFASMTYSASMIIFFITLRRRSVFRYE